MNGPNLAERQPMSSELFVSRSAGSEEALKERLRNIKRICDLYQDAYAWEGSTPALEHMQEIKRQAIEALEITGECAIIQIGGEA